ncbi:MAG TPA: N-acetyltransferase family protein [Dehalococcoidia bacterium]|nr:N-acetyltransferase family protein [Dehalococcoidia bacterium]
MKTIKFIIEPMGPEDWEAVREIYLEGIATGHPTIETEAPPWERWNNSHRPDCRLVARDGEQVVGWAALSPVPSRPVYSGVAEVSVYVAAHFRRRGTGRLLLDPLVSASESAGVWTLQASIDLHSACGFRTVGTRERIGGLKDYWRDTVLMERRSEAPGV